SDRRAVCRLRELDISEEHASHRESPPAVLLPILQHGGADLLLTTLERVEELHGRPVHDTCDVDGAVRLVAGRRACTGHGRRLGPKRPSHHVDPAFTRLVLGLTREPAVVEAEVAGHLRPPFTLGVRLGTPFSTAGPGRSAARNTNRNCPSECRRP